MLQFLSLFSGIGAFEKALDRLGVEYNLVNYCEIDKYASKSYSAIHNVPESLNLGDITKVDTSKLPHVDVVSYGFPCQDISLAGRQKGLFNEDGELTRSGLFFEALRIIEDTKPKVAIAENVKNLTSKKFAEQFEIVLDSLESAGYNNYWSILNSRDFGIPQNRERVFIVSIRKDIDNGCFKFPEPFELKLRLKDLLEPEVDEKFYLSDAMINYCIGVGQKDSKFPRKDRFIQNMTRDNINVANALTTGEGSRPVSNFVYGNCEKLSDYVDDFNDNDELLKVLNGSKSKLMPVYLNSKGGRGGVEGLQPSVQDRVYDSEAISTAVTTSYMPSIAIRENTAPQQGVVINDKWISDKGVNYICSPKRGMCTDINPNVAQTLTAKGQSNWTGSFISPDIDKLEKSTTIGSGEPTTVHLKNGEKITSNDDLTGLRIRKLTPLECFRLMGFDDEDFYKAEKVNSNTQLYKQAGNSIVVDVLEYLFKEILEVVDMKRVDDKVVVYECDDLINLEALKEKEPELYEELLADYPCENGTYIFKHKNF